MNEEAFFYLEMRKHVLESIERRAAEHRRALVRQEEEAREHAERMSRQLEGLRRRAAWSRQTI